MRERERSDITIHHQKITTMSSSSSSSSMLLFLVLAVLLSYFLLTSLIRKKNRNSVYRVLPPGPHGLPILGNLHMLGDLPHQNLYQLSLKYGPIMYIKLGLVPAIVVSSPDMAELVLKTHDINFASRPKVQSSEFMSYGAKGLGFTPYGSYWRFVKKLCTLHLLSNSKIESFKSTRREEVRIVVDSIRVSAESYQSVNLTEKVEFLVENIIYKMVLGIKDDKFNLRPTIQEALRLAGAFNIGDYVPYIGALDLQGYLCRMKAVSKVVDEFFEKIIDEHIKDARKQQEHHKDFIDVLLSLMDDDDTTQHENEKLSRSGIKAILLDMLAAGIDTSAVTIDWTMVELVKNPRVMKRVQEELETVVGLDRLVEESDLVKLEYLEMVIKESMRLHPVAPLLLPHESVEDMKINGYDIPKKSKVIVNIWGISRDPKIWSENAEEFYPERFIDMDIDVKGKDFRLIPFGSGRRGCPGMQLGLTMVRLILAQLVHCFDWELPNGIAPYDLDMSEKFGLTVPRAKHLIAVPHYRLSV